MSQKKQSSSKPTSLQQTLSQKQESALDKIAQYLSRRSHSKKELKQKLSRFFSSSVIEQALAQAEQKKWLENPMEISLKTAKNLHNKKKSWAYIKQYLQQKGLPLPEYDPEKEKEKIKQLLSKKKVGLSSSFNDRQKLKRFLAYRGFESQLINEILNGADLSINC